MYAVMDIGTNSVLLLAAPCGDDGRGEKPKPLEWTRITRLGRGMHGPGARLRPEAVAKTLEAVAFFREKLERTVPPGGGVATATCAVREAADGEEFLRRCARILGAPPRLLSGEEEAATAFLGAASDQPRDRPLLTVDVGGGSTEIALGTADACTACVSLPLGCVRFTDAFHLDAPVPDSVRTAAAARIRRELRNGLAPIHEAMRGLPDPPRFLTSGGTATTYAAWRLKLEPYDRRRVHGFTEQVERLEMGAREWLAMPAALRRSRPGVRPERGPVLAAGLLILAETLRSLGADGFRVTVRGLRYGMLLRLCRRRTTPDWYWPASGRNAG